MNALSIRNGKRDALIAWYLNGADSYDEFITLLDSAFETAAPAQSSGVIGYISDFAARAIEAGEAQRGTLYLRTRTHDHSVPVYMTPTNATAKIDALEKERDELREYLNLIAGIAGGSTTANWLQHINKLAYDALAGKTVPEQHPGLRRCRHCLGAGETPAFNSTQSWMEVCPCRAKSTSLLEIQPDAAALIKEANEGAERNRAWAREIDEQLGKAREENGILHITKQHLEAECRVKQSSINDLSGEVKELRHKYGSIKTVAAMLAIRAHPEKSNDEIREELERLAEVKA